MDIKNLYDGIKGKTSFSDDFYFFVGYLYIYSVVHRLSLVWTEKSGRI